MSTLGDNLLKLTEFPFSYSLISLLVLISSPPPEDLSLSSQQLNSNQTLSSLDELDSSENELSLLTRYGSLLIVMGFVATTLSITDPIGYLQKLFLLIGSTRNLRNWRIHSTKSRIDELGRQFVSTIPNAVIRSLARKPSLELNTDVEVEIRHAMWSLILRTFRTKWIVREIDKTTAIAYFIVVVSIFVSAIISDELFHTAFIENKILTTFQGDPQVRYILLTFSIVAIGAVSYMLYKRLRDLRSNGETVFKYLVALDVIIIDKERFDKSLQIIERHLNDGDWTLADYWSTRVLQEYDAVVQSRMK